MTESVKKQMQLRGIYKGQLTKFSAFLRAFNGDEIAQLKKRFEKIEALWDDFQRCQMEIELVVDDACQIEEREQFENNYFELTAAAQQFIDEFEQKTESIRSSPVNDRGADNGNSNGQSRNTSVNNIKLPEIKLPEFDGAYSGYMEFRDSFMSMVDSNQCLPRAQKLNYLKSICHGEAANLLKPLKVIDANYEKAWSILRDHYEDKRNLINEHFKNLFELQVLVKPSAQMLKAFISTILTEISSLQELLGTVDEHMLLYLLESKLDHASKLAWESNIQNDKEREGSQSLPSLDKFERFVRSRYRVLENSSVRTSSKADNNSVVKSNNANKSNENRRLFSNVAVDNACVVCQGSHRIYSCKRFLELSTVGRFSEVKNKQLCTNCLRSGHFQNQCKSKFVCKVCHKPHNTLLHRNTNRDEGVDQSGAPRTDPAGGTEIIVSNTSTSASEQATNPVGCHAASSRTGDRSTNQRVQMVETSVLLPTAIIGVYNHKNEITYCRALLDSGSQSNFISKDLVGKLGIEQSSISLPVYGIGSRLTNISRRVEVKFVSTCREYSSAARCLVIDSITSILPQIGFNKSQFNIPKAIRLADENFDKGSNIDVLIGAGLFFELLCEGQIRLGRNLPILQNTQLGWVISGCAAGPILNPTYSCLAMVDDQIHEDLQRFWVMDENYPNKVWSREEQECEKHFVETHSRDQSGRFVVCLPFKGNSSALGDSLDMATRRFYSIERKLQKKVSLQVEYSRFMEEYEHMGHMIKIDTQKQGERGCYLPHHAVEKVDSTTTKLRVVFDASAKTSSGVSLNEVLKVGPVIQSDLFTILVRFRQHPIALVGDIAKMYRQIGVHPKDQELQRIVWRRDPPSALDHYKLTTVTYGTASASFLATRCLKQIAIECQEEYPVESRIIQSDFYVDDVLTGCRDVDQMISTRVNLTRILKRYGFELRKFSSNCSRVLQDTQTEEDLTTTGEYYIISDSDSIKTLGIAWNPSTDNFEYRVRCLASDRVTKRAILSYIAQVFDPLGLLGPMITQAKLILQRLWQIKIPWDEALPGELHSMWLEFHSQLQNFDVLMIPRCVVVSDYQTVQIHGFCDASQVAFGAAIYIRVVGQNGAQSRLLCAKSRVAPIKSISIPRLELSSALVLARLYEKVSAALGGFPVGEVFFWTDSTIVLSWLSAEPHIWQTYVANRVAEIQQLTPVEQWHHVRSKQNPADIISRGATPNELSVSSLWWHGPSFLQESQDGWPKESHISNFSRIDAKSPEVRRVVTSLVGTGNLDSELFDRFSEFNTLLRFVAWTMRFVGNTRAGIGQRRHGALSCEELDHSLKMLVRVVQSQSFSSDLKALRELKRVRVDSKISSLDPFLDGDGILRVGGRLRHAAHLPYDQKHQILLPAKHSFTNLLINYEHLRYFHAGPQTLVNIMRRKYWPINAKQVISVELRKCVTCIRADPRVINQQMGDLPGCRVTPARAFAVSGVDYCGPFQIKEGRLRHAKYVKGYVCIFVCLSSKAVHLELAADLTTQSFLNCFERFVARRGLCKTLWSDNGTNFVGAKNEFAQIQGILNSGKINEYFSRNNVEWKFIPANSPHMGGIWEAAVRSFKHYVHRVTNGFRFSYDEFNTFITQVEAIMNSRPLVPLSNDPNDLEAITPGHLLIGEALLGVPQVDLDSAAISPRARYLHVCKMAQQFWKRWSNDYLNSLQQRTKWRFKKEADLTVGALVLLKEDNRPSLQWPMGRVTAVHPGADGVVRVLSIKTRGGVLKRAINRVCLLPVS